MNWATLDFSLVPSHIEGARIEQKICEACGCPYWRAAVAQQKGAADVLCSRCVEDWQLRVVKDSEDYAAALAETRRR